MKIDKKLFFSSYRKHVQPIRKTSTVQNLDLLIDIINSDKLPQLNQLAYMLATAGHETSTGGEYSFNYKQKEVRQRSVNTARRRQIRAWQDKYWYSGYYGRGFVMLTWKRNYANATLKLRNLDVMVDLINNPDQVLNARIGWLILRHGMGGGWFTGKHIGIYLNPVRTDFYNARRTVNGTFHANRVARLAKKLLKVLKASVTVEEPVVLPPIVVEEPVVVNKATPPSKPSTQPHPLKPTLFSFIIQIFNKLLRLFRK